MGRIKKCDANKTFFKIVKISQFGEFDWDDNTANKLEMVMNLIFFFFCWIDSIFH